MLRKRGRESVPKVTQHFFPHFGWGRVACATMGTMNSNTTTTTNQTTYTFDECLILYVERTCAEWAKGHHFVRPTTKVGATAEVVLVHPKTGDEFVVHYG